MTPDSLLWTAREVTRMHIEGSGTCPHEVFVSSSVGFLGSKELPLEHAGVEKISLLASQKEHDVQLHALLPW